MSIKTSDTALAVAEMIKRIKDLESVNEEYRRRLDDNYHCIKCGGSGFERDAYSCVMTDDPFGRDKVSVSHLGKYACYTCSGSGKKR